MTNMSVSRALFQVRDHLEILKWVSCNGSESDIALWAVDPEKMYKELYMPPEMVEEVRKLVNECVYIRDYIKKTVSEMPDFSFEPDVHTDLLHLMTIDDH